MGRQDGVGPFPPARGRPKVRLRGVEPPRAYSAHKALNLAEGVP